MVMENASTSDEHEAAAVAFLTAKYPNAQLIRVRHGDVDMRAIDAFRKHLSPDNVVRFRVCRDSRLQMDFITYEVGIV